MAYPILNTKLARACNCVLARNIVPLILILLLMPAIGATILSPKSAALAAPMVSTPPSVVLSFTPLTLMSPAAKPLPVGCTIALAWDASPDASVTGYRIYYGAASGNYTNSVAVGLVTNATVNGLLGGMKYFFAATAFNAVVESDFSNEVMAYPPAKIYLTVDRWAITTTGVLGVTNDLLATTDLISTNWLKVNTWLGDGGPKVVTQSNGTAMFYRVMQR